MSTTTTRLSLVKPALTDAADVTANNGNWDTLDKAVMAPNGSAKVSVQTADGVNIIVANAGVQVSLAITFPTPFVGTPVVNLTITALSGGSGGYVTLVAGSKSNTGFTVFANSYLAQTITFSWEAVGS